MHLTLLGKLGELLQLEAGKTEERILKERGISRVMVCLCLREGGKNQIKSSLLASAKRRL